MKTMKMDIGIALLFVVLLGACHMPEVAVMESTPDDQALSTIVAETLQVMLPTASSTSWVTATIEPTPTSSLGEFSGRVCYRNAAMAQLTLYFENVSNSQVIELSVSRPQDTYTIQLAPGTYRVYGWPSDFSIGVLSQGGNLSVSAGQIISGIDFCDWSHGPFDVPYPPNYSSSQVEGSISGGIYGYPYGSVPKLSVVAFNQSTHFYYYFLTVSGQTSYSMSGYIPAGSYQVIAYDQSGHAGGCPSSVTVVSGQMANADITDWSGSYRSKPADVP